MFTSLLITLREGLEAALILAVVISFLMRSDGGHLVKHVWYGAVAAALASLAAGGLLFAIGGSLSDEAGTVFEVVATFAAAVLLTYMIFWMRNNGRSLKSGLEDKARSAKSTSPLALTLLAFAAVGREGLETALFLFATAASSSAWSALTGGVAGLVIAAVAGVALYRGSVRLNLRTFFGVTGFLLILFAGGLLSYAIHEAEELGIVAASFAQPLWDTSAFLSHESGAGAILKALFGYRANPSLLQVIAYWTYLTTMSWFYFRPHSMPLQGVTDGGS